MSQDWGLSQFVFSQELKLIGHWQVGRFKTHYKLLKVTDFEICPRCAVISRSVHDKRWVHVQDAPIRGVGIYLHILKRRFMCPTCKKVFTEPVDVIQKGYRTTRRYRRSLAWACNNLLDLKRVQRAYHCSAWLVYKVFYQQLEIKYREIKNDPWPSTIGIDEHSFKRNTIGGYREFATIVTDYKNKRIKEVVHGKTTATLEASLSYIEGRENVKNVCLDLCDPFKNFARSNFPNAKIIADKFHVLRLLNPAINRHRKEITGDQRSNPVRKLLLRNGHKLEYFEHRALWTWLNLHPTMRELYFFKESLHRLYRCKGVKRARQALINLCDQMSKSSIKEVLTLRKTLIKWAQEILNYFETRLTNARTEGFNNLAKLYQKRAFGYKNFQNYRLRLLNAG